MENENAGIRLLKKGRTGLVHALFSRLGLFVLLMLVQVAVLFVMFKWFADLLPHFWGGTILFNVFMILCIVSSRSDPTAKITWLVIVALIPVFGALLYVYIESNWGHRLLARRLKQIGDQTQNAIPHTDADALARQSPEAAGLAHYLAQTGCHPVFANTTVTYFPVGERKFEELLRQLEKAEKFIYLEYFIINEGVMWGRILEILAKKAAQGVDVRVMYDGTNEFTTLPHDYPRRLRELGIQCKVFSPPSPFISTRYNYRDHRKILIIDGHTAFNGGVNLADEYINETIRFGHWKDNAVMLQGEAARSFTLMFLQLWSVEEKEPKFRTSLNYEIPPRQAPGFVIPYGDSPLDTHMVGERVYMDLLNRAKKYVHIFSPYLILDGEMETALRFAAQRGVDVKLILPGIPDKKAPYALAKSYYTNLMEAGVEIYEYDPGFVHAKMFVMDGMEAVIGTINLDYRSLYHHFECATWLVQTPCISEMEADFQQTLAVSRQVTRETVWNGAWYYRPLGFLLKAIAPLL